jgi:tryptophanyl-tRNA synthetase
MRIVTDSKTLEEPKDPDGCTVFALYRLFATDAERQALAERYRAGGYGYGQAKKLLFETLWSYFEPLRKRRAELQRDPAQVEAILGRGAERARAEARHTLAAARRAMGLD